MVFLDKVESWFLRQTWIDSMPEVVLGVVSGPMGCASAEKENISVLKPMPNLFGPPDMKFKSFSSSITSRVLQPILFEDTEIQGINCAEGSEVEFDESGKLRAAELAEDQVIQGIKFAKFSKVWFDESGKLRN